MENNSQIKHGELVLKNGRKFKGVSFGYDKSTAGEVVFNTGMVGYPETLTDPSYYGQILVITFPIIGNYGVPDKSTKDNILEHFESKKIHLKGLIISSYSDQPDHHQSIKSLGDWLKEEKIPALHMIDTRELTKMISGFGSILGKITFNDESINFYDPNRENLSRFVTDSDIHQYIGGDGKLSDKSNFKRIYLIDCGNKNSILKKLLKFNVIVTTVPYDYNFIADYEFIDGLLISNGPGNPDYMQETINNVKKFMMLDINGEKPIFGICLGHQILAMAAGATIYKMKYGNRSMNQPVIDLRSRRCYITPQNHGFAVNENTLPKTFKPLFVNANDDSNEGIVHITKPYFSVQFHPEGNGGPDDTEFLFDSFINLVNTLKFPISTIKRVKKHNIKKILLLGSGGICIGQAGEFDYSGSQCIKALKEENIEVILVNPNIATIQTSEFMANKTYFEPVIPETVEKIIKKEKPDGIMLQFGGQTALNCGIKLMELGIFERYNIEVLGTQIPTIIATEDRKEFNRKLSEIDEPYIETFVSNSVDSCLKFIDEKIGYPVLVRSSYSLGGLGSGFAVNESQFRKLANIIVNSGDDSTTITVSKSLQGWKEVEYEIVRDITDNCIAVCNMENFDPVGIHTGDSIVVSPSLTLNNNEYFKLRKSAIKIARHLNILGECNVQFALDPDSDSYFIIEVNARLSRSSALASKATGYPLAYVAAKLSLNKSLIEIDNSITKTTCACFEPSLDYCVIKFPRWDNQKFTNSTNSIGSCMKSVGEVMAIGRSFEEAFLKGLRMMNESFLSFKENANVYSDVSDEELEKQLVNPNDKRVYYIFEAFNRDKSVEDIFKLTQITKWFLHKLCYMVKLEKSITAQSLTHRSLKEFDNRLFNRDSILKWKQTGFSDKQIGDALGDYGQELSKRNGYSDPESYIRNLRISLNVKPFVKQIDTLAAEFPAKTNYLYCSYNANYHDLDFNENGIMVLGCGAYRIGSSVEFDWSTVSCNRTLKQLGKKSIMINYNPETVSTDYDECDRLYFEELSLERVLDIYQLEDSEGVIVSVGGQIPNKLAIPMSKNNVNILGTQPKSIDNAENRYKFSNILDDLGIDQPEWNEFDTLVAAKRFIQKINYPVIIRPSYVLSGSAMIVAYNEEDLTEYINSLKNVNREHPIVISKFIDDAKEIEMDAVANNGEIINYAISEHIENAGVHSGDATLLLPPQKLYIETIKKIRKITAKIAKYLNITGPVNIQFLSKNNDIKVIECNLRASRSFPFVSKTFNVNFIELATKAMVGAKVKRRPINISNIDFVCIKCPIFSFTRLDKVDPILKVEMSSTGEVACFGFNKYDSYMKSITASKAVSEKKIKSVVVSIGSMKHKIEMTEAIETLKSMKIDIYSTPETNKYLKEIGIDTELIYKPDSEEEPNIIDLIKSNKIDLIINIPKHESLGKKTNGYYIRRAAIDSSVPLMTNVKNSKLFISTIKNTSIKKAEVYSWQDYIKTIDF